MEGESEERRLPFSLADSKTLAEFPEDGEGCGCKDCNGILDEERGEGVGRGMLAVVVGQKAALPLPVVFWIQYLPPAVRRRFSPDYSQSVQDPRRSP